MTTTTLASPAKDHRDWAGLPVDLLRCAFQLLSVPSRVCFRGVCRSWQQAAAAEDKPTTAMPPPWVVIPHDIGCSKSFTLLSIPTMQSFRWSPPGGLGGLRCVGSSGGWLAGAYIDAGRMKRVALVNPLTGARVEVPASPGRAFAAAARYGRADFQEAALCRAFQKVAFAPNPTARDFAVAVVTQLQRPVRLGKAVAFVRAGHDGWCALAELPDDEHSRPCSYKSRLDVAYRDGKFYYVTSCRQVWVVDMAAAHPSPAPLARLIEPSPGCHFSCNYHIAFSGDGALHVVWSPADDVADSVYVLAQRYDPTSSPVQGAWTEARRLRGQAFLAGDLNQTLCVAAGGGDGEWLEPGSVYFTNTTLCSLLAEEHRESRLNGVGVWRFDLATGDIGQPSSQVRKAPVVVRPLDLSRPAWTVHQDVAEADPTPEETWKYPQPALDWTTAVWLMPSLR